MSGAHAHTCVLVIQICEEIFAGLAHVKIVGGIHSGKKDTRVRVLHVWRYRLFHRRRRNFGIVGSEYSS